MTWYDSDYGYKKKITIDHTKVSGDEINFPILISVTDANLADEANSGHVKNSSGYDIIFTNGDEDTQLKHEIERYVNTDGILVFWVKIDSLSSTSDTDLYIYYGKTGVVADPSTTDTWDSNFLFVSHMKNDPDTTHIADSTSTGNDGTKNAETEPEQANGKMGYAQDFELADTEKIKMDASTAPMTKLLVEAWINPESDGILSTIVADMYDTAAFGQLSWRIERRPDNKMSSVSFKNDGILWNFIGNTTVLAADGWTYVVLRWDGSNVYIYIDGNQDGIAGAAGVMSSHASREFTIGGEKDVGTYKDFFDGIIDEIRVSDSERSANWIITTHNTQSNPNTFMSWGAEENGAVETYTPSDTVNVSDDIIFKHKIFIPETININDSILIKRLLSLSDTVDVNDSILFKRLLNLLDTVDVSDSVSFKHFLNLLDTVDVDDSVSFKHLLNLLDTINVGDSVSFKRLLSLLDTIDVNDSVSFKHLISLLDTVDVSDSASFGNYNFLNLQDTVDVSDSVSFKHLISLLDSIDISDNFAYYSFTVELLKLYLFDAVNVNDSVSFKRLLNLFDTVAVSDAISFKHILNFIESVNIADSISFKHLLNLFDSINVDDNVLYIKFDEKLYVHLSDLINIDDSVSFKHRINLNDNITIDEAIVVSYLLNLSDTIKIDDSVFGELVLSLQGDSYTVNLPMPEHGGESGSVDNELKLFNFWSDDIEVDTIGIDSEPITIQGVIKSWSDNANADMLIIATKFLNIHDMMKKREEITIKGLGGCFDAVYMIKNFSYNTVKNSPYEYTWNLSLEYVRAL